MTLTLQKGNFHCNRCEITFSGTFKPQQRPRKSCPKCHKMCDRQTLSHTSKPKKGKGGHAVIPPQTNKENSIIPSQPSPILASMTDNDLARHRIRLILTNIGSTNREVLDAVGKMVNYMDKAGTINIEEQSEKEVLDKFRNQSTQSLVNMLKESSQSEP